MSYEPTIYIAEEMTDNEALREILGQLRRVQSDTAEQYDAVAGVNNEPVSASITYERAADPTAVKTVITNLGATPIVITEGGYVVAIKAQYESWTSPLNGGGAITVKCATAGNSTIAVATYTKG